MLDSQRLSTWLLRTFENSTFEKHQTNLQIFFFFPWCPEPFKPLPCGCCTCFPVSQSWEKFASIVFCYAASFSAAIRLPLNCYLFVRLTKPNSITWFSDITPKAPSYLVTLYRFSPSFSIWEVWNRMQYLMLVKLQCEVPLIPLLLAFPLWREQTLGSHSTWQSVWSAALSQRGCSASLFPRCTDAIPVQNFALCEISFGSLLKFIRSVWTEPLLLEELVALSFSVSPTDFLRIHSISLLKLSMKILNNIGPSMNPLTGFQLDAEPSRTSL